MVFLTCSVSFRSISCRYFAKWVLKIFSGGNHPPYPRTLTAFPTPALGSTPGFFRQNDRKGCKRDYLDARGHFVLRFGNHPSPPPRQAGQKCRFAEILSEWLRWIDKREDFINVPDVFGGNEATWSNFKTSRITGESIIQNIRNKVSIFLSLAIVNFLDVIFNWHCQLN